MNYIQNLIFENLLFLSPTFLYSIKHALDVVYWVSRSVRVSFIKFLSQSRADTIFQHSQTLPGRGRCFRYTPSSVLCTVARLTINYSTHRTLSHGRRSCRVAFLCDDGCDESQLNTVERTERGVFLRQKRVFMHLRTFFAV